MISLPRKSEENITKSVYLPDKTVVSTVKYLCRCSSALSCGNSLESSQNPHLKNTNFQSTSS